MPKCGLGHLGAKRAPTAPLERLGAFGPLETPKNVVHVCKSAKVDFCNFIFMFSKNKKVTKSHFHVLAYVYDVFGCSEGSESQSCVLSTLELKVRRFNCLSFFVIRVRRFLMVLGRRSAKVAPKRVLSAKTRFGTPKTSKNVVHV